MGGMFGSAGGMGGSSFTPFFRSAGMDEDSGLGGRKRSSFGSGMPGGGMPGGFTSAQRPSSPHRDSTPTSVPEIIRPLALSLQELYTGTTKHLKVSRKLLNGGVEDRVLDITVLPGWKSGTKIRFPKAGNEVKSDGYEVISQDLVFVVEEKEHPTFKRDGNDLIATVEIRLVDALTNPLLSSSTTPTPLPRTIKHLDGRDIQIPLPRGVIKPGQKTRIPREGMPVRGKGADGHQKGDLIIEWKVEFPDVVPEQTRKELARILRGV
jgi:DnaJ family protein B protein 4